MSSGRRQRVGHAHRELAGLEAEAERHRLAGRVLARVGQPFLGRPERDLADLLGQRPRRAGDGEVHGRVAGRLVLPGQRGQLIGQRRRVLAQGQDGPAGRGQALPGQRPGPVDALDRLGQFGVVRGQRGRGQQALGGLQVDRHRGQRVGQHVVDVAGDPGSFGERGRVRLGLAGAAGLGQHVLGLLGPDQELAAGQAHAPEPGEGERVTQQHPGGRPGGQRRDQEPGDGLSQDPERQFGPEPDARAEGRGAADGERRAVRRQPDQHAAHAAHRHQAADRQRRRRGRRASRRSRPGADRASVTAIATWRGSPVPRPRAGQGHGDEHDDKAEAPDEVGHPGDVDRAGARGRVRPRRETEHAFAPGLAFQPGVAGITVARGGREVPARAG